MKESELVLRLKRLGLTAVEVKRRSAKAKVARAKAAGKRRGMR